MAAPLKDHFAAHTVAAIRADLERAGIDPGAFEATANAGLLELELMDRCRHVGRALRACLPDDPEAALVALVACLGPKSSADDLTGMAVFKYMPHVTVIADLGVHAPEAGLSACYEVTQRFTAESCIRPIAAAHRERTVLALQEWVHDPNLHVRRLVSEGTRPRLPWASRLDLGFHTTRPLLDVLRDDPEEYVRRSVANHLNDVTKDHPGEVLDLLEGWAVGAAPPRQRLIRHALRTLVKHGDPRALHLLGFAGGDVRVEGFEVPPQVARGGAAPYRFDLVSTGAAEQNVVVDVVVGFRKARGQVAPKVFKLANLTIAPGARVALDGKVRLHEMTTRTHYPGIHTIEVQVNGVRHVGGAFELV